MPDTMTTTVSVLGGYGKPRRHVVTLPRIEALLAEPASRYSVPAVEPARQYHPPRSTAAWMPHGCGCAPAPSGDLNRNDEQRALARSLQQH